MLTGRPRQFELTLTETERRALTAAAHSRTLPYSHARGAQLIVRRVGVATARRLRPALGFDAP